MYHKLVDVVGIGLALLADSEADAEQRQQESDLDRLERWLTAAEAALLSLRCKPQQLTSFEEALTLHTVSFPNVGVVVSGIRRMNEVNAHRARLVPGWVTVFGRYTISVCNKPTRSTQPCIPPGSLNRVPASAGDKGGNVTSAGWQVTLCDPMWHVSGNPCELLCTCYLLTYSCFSCPRVY